MKNGCLLFFSILLLSLHFSKDNLWPLRPLLCLMVFGFLRTNTDFTLVTLLILFVRACFVLELFCLLNSYMCMCGAFGIVYVASRIR